MDFHTDNNYSTIVLNINKHFPFYNNIASFAQR